MDENSRESAQQRATDEPLFLIGARKQAAKNGISVKELLAADRVAAEVPEFPTSECLLPEDAEDYLFAQRIGKGAHSAALNEAKNAHLAQCLFCQTMVSSLEPSLNRQEEFLKVVRQEARYGAVGQMDSLLDKLRALCKLTWPIALPGLVVLTFLIVGHLSADGWLLTATLKSEAASLVAHVSIAVVTALVAFSVYVMQRQHLPFVARFVFTISLTIGIATTASIMLFTGSEWHEASVALRSSEEILVRKLADSYESNRNGDVFPAIVNVDGPTQISTVGNSKESAIYRASSKDLPGSLVARTKKDKGQVSVDVGGKEYNSLDITIGKAELVSNGRYRVVSANGESVYGKLHIPTQEAVWEGMTTMAVKRSGKESLAELYPLKPAALKNR